MSIEMYVSASRRQAESTKKMIQHQLSGYTELERAIGQFVFNSQLLTGAAYDSAKSHYSSVLLPLVKGGKLYSEAVARAVQRFPEEYVAKVDSGNLKEAELEKKIAQLTTRIRVKRDQQAYLRSLSLHLPSDEKDRYNGSQRSLANSLETLERTKRKVIEKLQKLREFNISSVTLFAELDGLQRNISLGSQLATSSFNGSTFVKPNASQLTWANEINQKWEQRQPEITMTSEWVRAGGAYQYQVYKIYTDGIYDKEQSDELNKLMAEAFSEGIVDAGFVGLHTVGEFVLYNDLYRLIYGKDWLSGDEASRAEALGWLALTVFPVSKLAQLSKEIKAGNNLLKGVSLTENELKILTNAGFFENGATAVENEVVKKASGAGGVNKPPRNLIDNMDEIADDIRNINKKYSSGFEQNNSIDSIINSASYYEDAWEQTSAVTRGIAEHAFVDGNKRTAFDTLNMLLYDLRLKSPLNDTQKWDLINRIGTGDLKNVSEIANILKGK